MAGDATSMAAANAAFVMAYGVGSLAGPAAGGVGMDAMNPQGVLIVTSGIAVIYLVFLAVRQIQRRPA